MTTRNLSAATSDLIESYGNAARNVINAYRVGGERVLGFMDQRWERALDKTGNKLSAEVRGNALSAQKKICGYYAQGIAMTTAGADAVVSKAVQLAARSVRQAAANANQFEKRTGTMALHHAAQAVVPAIDAVQKVASVLEQQSDRLANRIAGKPTHVKFAEVKRVTPFKKARARKAA